MSDLFPRSMIHTHVLARLIADDEERRCCNGVNDRNHVMHYVNAEWLKLVRII